MKLRPIHILIAAMVLLLSAVGCGRRGRVIPADTFAQMYAEVFIADQWLSDHVRFRKTADTSNFYEPLFEEFGYTFKDYNRSVEYYIDKPEKYARVLEKTSEILGKRLDELKKEEAMIEEVNKLLRYLKENALDPVDFENDTLLWKLDTAVVDSVAVDTIAVDTIKNVVDVKGRHGFRADSLTQAWELIGDQSSPKKRKAL